METIQMTISQEKTILQYLSKAFAEGKAEMLGTGSSRSCWDIDNDAENFIKQTLGLDTDVNLVIKVAMGIGGQTQSNREIATFLDYGDEYLARIYAYGRIIEIMEKVNELSKAYREWDDCEEGELFINAYGLDKELNANRLDEDGYYSTPRLLPLGAKEEDKAEFDKAMSTIEALNDIFGETGDNGQIGRASDGRIVAYDYGFDTFKCEDERWSSDLVELAFADKGMSDYFDTCVKYLTSEEEIGAALEKYYADK